MAWEQQSPVNLRDAICADSPQLQIRLAWGASSNAFCVQGEHGVEVIYPITPERYLEMGGKRFSLRSLHFHHPSEHLVDGNQFLGEVHVVHQNLEDCSLAVIGIFLAIRKEMKETKESDALSETFQEAKVCSCLFSHRPAYWLPENTGRAFRYEGSLTTPPYSESASWVVLPTPKFITPKLFRSVFGEKPQRARGIQPLNRRFILDMSLKVVLSK